MRQTINSWSCSTKSKASWLYQCSTVYPSPTLTSNININTLLNLTLTYNLDDMLMISNVVNGCPSNYETVGWETVPLHKWLCRMQAVYWLLSGECRLYIGCCLENAGCNLVLVWRMQVLYCQGNTVWSCLENPGCNLVLVWRMQVLYCQGNTVCDSCLMNAGCDLVSVTWWECRL